MHRAGGGGAPVGGELDGHQVHVEVQALHQFGGEEDGAVQHAEEDGHGSGAFVVGVHPGGDGVDGLFDLVSRDEGFENLVVKFDSVFHGVLF